MANEKRLTWKRSLDGYTDVGLCDGVTVDEAICKLADLEEKNAVEVVHGYWVATPVRKLNSKGKLVYYCDYHHCSECGTDRPIVPPYNYCPNCGARMDGGEEDGT